MSPASHSPFAGGLPRRKEQDGDLRLPRDGSTIERFRNLDQGACPQRQDSAREEGGRKVTILPQFRGVAPARALELPPKENEASARGAKCQADDEADEVRLGARTVLGGA